MHALIISTNGEDYVHVSGTENKLEKKAIEIIRGHIPDWDGFGSLDVEKLLIEALDANEVNGAMELYADISEARGEMVFMRIVPAELEMDAWC